MDKVIVIGCKVPGYAVIRALGGKGIYIIALTYSNSDFAHLSKHVSEVMHVPPPEVDEKEFINVLVKNADRWHGALLLESSDSIAVAISKNKEILSKYYKIVTPDWEILKLFLEKEKTYALARECGVPYPQSRHLESLSDLNEVENFKFPCILKPIRSFEFSSRFQVKNFNVKNKEELWEKFQFCLDAEQDMILQEIIPGSDDNLFKLHGYINSKGKMVGKLFYRKLRQNPPQFGVMRVGVSTEKNLGVEVLTERLLNHANYRGYFNTEFKMDSRDSTLKLIEVNCRMPRGGMLPAASGVNFPWIIFMDLVMNRQIEVTEFKTGTYWIELYADISNTLFRRKEEKIRLRDYIKPYLARDKTFADLDFQDLRPFLKIVSLKMGHPRRKIAGNRR